MKTQNRWKKAYTFAEVLVASALVGIVAGGAVKLMGTMSTSELSARNGTVAINLLDNAAKLWRLGLTPAEVLAVMPAITDNEFVQRGIVDYSGSTVSFGTPGTTVLANSMGTLEYVPISVTAEDPQGANNRGYTVQACRPTAR
jgi:hypothetical protein